jgi:hypothetical protein
MESHPLAMLVHFITERGRTIPKEDKIGSDFFPGLPPFFGLAVKLDAFAVALVTRNEDWVRDRDFTLISPRRLSIDNWISSGYDCANCS